MYLCLTSQGSVYKKNNHFSNGFEFCAFFNAISFQDESDDDSPRIIFLSSRNSNDVLVKYCVVVFCCPLQGLEFRIIRLLDWLSPKAR